MFRPRNIAALCLALAMLVSTQPAAVAKAPATAQAQPDFSLDVKYGVLVGLTGDAATGGQAWNQAAKIAVDYINQNLQQNGYSDQFKATLVDSQDSEGNAQRGVEAAQKLVSIDDVDVVVGDLFSSVTSAVAPSVIIPNGVLEFTGGTNPSLTQLNPAGSPTLLWQPVAADDLQGRVLAKLMGDAFGTSATVNIGVRNDAYGTGLSDVFKNAWTAQGGTVGKVVTYNPAQPTFDTEAQQLVDGNPDAWLFTDFCQTFAKLVGPLQRTGKWDGARTWGGDALTNCGVSVPDAAVPGMRSVQANSSAGSSFADYQNLFVANAQTGVTFSAFTAEAFDSVFIAFLGAVAARSSDPAAISARIADITNPPGQDYTFLQLNDAIQALLAGQQIHFNGATGPLNFSPGGRVTATAYDVWQVAGDKSAAIAQTVNFTP
jgi:ABC-type branched-subunit amino acid transport system substrate-binding protein